MTLWTYRDKDLVRASLAEDSLMDFVRFMWDAVEPGRQLTEGWVLHAICDHLEAVTRGGISRLIMNVPPGSMKSLLTQVFWPAWVWGPKRRPAARFLCLSYSASLTIRDNVRFRQIVQSPRYQRHWGSVFGISDTEAGKQKFANDKTGWKLASSVGGTVTGERGDFVILDDPNSVDESESEAIRESTNRWLRETLPTRLNDPARSAIICIQQRTHEEDATGVFIKDDKNGIWTWLVIPMRYDPSRHCRTEIGWEDPRTEEGELMWPERFSEEVVERDSIPLGPYGVAGQFQQMPVPRGGAILRREWIEDWGDPDLSRVILPPCQLVIAFVDGAYTEKEDNDPSAMVVLGIFNDPMTGDARVCVLNAWEEWLEIHGLVERVAKTCRKYNVDRLLIENKASGHSVSQELRRLYGDSDWITQLLDPEGRDKVSRAHSVVPLMAAGLLFCPGLGIPGLAWAHKLADQISSFPRGSHDDLTDALVGGLMWLRKNGVLLRDPEARAQERRMIETARPLRPIYGG